MRFLLIEDDAEYRRLLRYHLEVEWPDAEIEEHQPCSSGRRPGEIALDGIDAVLLGHPLAGEKGFLWLRELGARRACPPVLLFSEPSDEFLAVDALKAGAASFFPKRKLTHRRLIATIYGEISGTAPAGAALAERVLRGTRRHRFLAELHASDLATVYLAEDEETGERVVCKVMRPDGPGAVFERFLLEYEVVAQLRHPNLVRIFDLGIADDHAYIVMEHFPGGTLAERLGRPLPPDCALGYASQIAAALEVIHGAGVLHRDLKPANVMFRADETLALIDFGLAKQLRLEAAITGTGQIFGTPYYMSPEQGHAQPADRRADIYGLGCILHEMLTGEKPFLAATAMGLIYRHAHAPRPRLGASLAHLQGLLDRMLAVDPAARHQDATQLLEELEVFAKGSAYRAQISSTR